MFFLREEEIPEVIARWKRHPFAERSGAKDIVDSGTGLVRSDCLDALV